MCGTGAAEARGRGVCGPAAYPANRNARFPRRPCGSTARSAGPKRGRAASRPFGKIQRQGGAEKIFSAPPPAPYRRADEPVPVPSFVRGGALPFFAPPPPPASPRRSGRQRSLVCSALPLSEKSLLRKSFSNGYEGVATLLRPCGAPFPFNGGRLGRAPPSQTFSRSGRATLALPFQFFPQKRVPENRRAQLEISGKRRRRRASRAF